MGHLEVCDWKGWATSPRVGHQPSFDLARRPSWYSWFIETSGMASFEQRRKRQKAAHAPNASAQAKGKAPLSTPQPPTVANAMPTKAPDEGRQRCKPDQTAWWKTSLELATLLVASLGLWVFHGQWEVAQEGNRLSSLNFRAGQRAWVGIIGFEFVPPKPEQPIIWQTVLKNFGNSPAMGVEIRDTAQLVVSSRVDPTMAWMLTADLPNATGKTLTMFNGQTYTNQGGRNWLLYQSQIEDVNHGKAILVYVAEIQYRDIFGSAHKTMICQVMDALGTHGCGFGDQAD